MKKAIFATIMIMANIFPQYLLGATYTASSCSQSAVSAAIWSASDGDTVTIPNCSNGQTWTTPLTITKAITLQGAGIGNTVLLDGVNSGPMLEFSVTGETKSWRLTGIEFRGGGATKQWGFMLKMSGNSQSFQIDNCRFYNWADTNRAIGLYGDLRGVIYLNDFNNGNKFTQALLIDHSDWNGYANGDGSWADNDNLGTGDFIFIEQNTFTGPTTVAYPASLDCYGGARVVFRYNTVNNDFVGTHGTESHGRGRGVRSFEFYNNTFNHSGGAWFTAIYIRSGTGVIYNNLIKASPTSEFSRAALLANYRSTQSFAIWGQCNGSSGFDQNSGSPAGYACLDQPGRGKGNLMSGANPNAVWPNQALSPIYVWGNSGYSSAQADSDSVHVALNRDYYVGTAKPGYTAYTYPHPLRSGGGSSTLIDAPTGLKVIPK